jgi:hypothetical protein
VKKVNLPTSKIARFTGKWIVIDPLKARIIAVGDTLKEISHLVTRSTSDKKPSSTVPAAFKVPRKDEGPYVLRPKSSMFLLTKNTKIETSFPSSL